jgi:hypothetical protein
MDTQTTLIIVGGILTLSCLVGAACGCWARSNVENAFLKSKLGRK